MPRVSLLKCSSVWYIGNPNDTILSNPYADRWMAASSSVFPYTEYQTKYYNYVLEILKVLSSEMDPVEIRLIR